jgi:hypothetical protein
MDNKIFGKGAIMKRESKNCLSGYSWRRILAVVLALSIVILPVQVPGIATAAEVTVPDTFY